MLLNHAFFYYLAWEMLKNAVSSPTEVNPSEDAPLKPFSKVKIVHRGLFHQAEIKDISPESLQECFDLSELPRYLLDAQTNEIIHSKNWNSKLKASHMYRIKEDGYITGAFKKINQQQVRKNITVEDLHSIVLQSLIASTAVYKLEHKEKDNKLLRTYLYEQFENHHFEYIIPSKHGEDFYLIAKEKGQSRLYVAFRGTKNLLELKYNFQVRFLFFISIYSLDFFIFFFKTKFLVTVT